MQTKPTGNCTALSWVQETRTGSDSTRPLDGAHGACQQGPLRPHGPPAPLGMAPPRPARDPRRTSSHTITLVGKNPYFKGPPDAGSAKSRPHSLDVVWGRRKVGTGEGPWEPSQNRARFSTLPDTCMTPVSVTPQGAPSHHLTITSQELHARCCGSGRQYEMLNTLLPADTPELLLHAQKFPLK